MTMLFLGMGNVNAQEKEPQTVIIKVCEFAINIKSQILVIEPDGNSNKLLLDKVTSGNYEESMANNAKIVQKEINKWKKEGFTISGMTSDMETANRYTTIILSKE
jgi:hypothetical protein